VLRALFLLDAALAILFLVHVPAGFSSQSTVTWVGQLSLAAGAGAIVASPKSWRHLVGGLALLALGTPYTGVLGPRVSLTTIALLQTVLAASLPSIPFTLLFLAFAAHLIPISHNFHPEIFALAAFFAYSSYSRVPIAWNALPIPSHP
jgi:hypothetical protein